MTRTFDDRIATREKTPILVGLVGPSGSGKTYSALRLAAGFQKVSGGETFVIDTEARRSLHYAERFRFRHLAFGAPFSPLDYLDAIEHCIAKGATTIVVDSMSHEHEGPGGVLEMHDAEVQRMAKGDARKAEAVKMLAWNRPKSARRRLINSILQKTCNFVFCFRAKEKLKIERGKEPERLGFQPIAGEEFVYEMTLKCLLLPGANGIPTWRSDMIGERLMIKLPEQFRATFQSDPQLTEDIGESLARWAAGAQSASKPTIPMEHELLERFAACSDFATLRALEDERGRAWSSLSREGKARVKEASALTAKRLEDAEKPMTQPIGAEEQAEIEAAEAEQAAKVRES